MFKDMGRRLSSDKHNLRYMEAAANAEASPPGVPMPSANLASWLEDQVKLGLLQPSALAEFRKLNGLPDRPLPAASGSAPQLDVATGPRTLDNEVSETDWQKVLRAYTRSGELPVIAEETGIELCVVRHLVNYGVRRLALPPVREAAVDMNAAQVRSEALVKQTRDPQYLTHLSQAREVATERVARETAAAQGMLISSLKTADAFLGYVNRVLEKTQEEDGYAMPDQVNAGVLNKLADTANKLATAVDKAIRLSRFTAGEPERNVTFEVAALIGRMDENDLREYLSTGAVPQHLRIKASNFIDADFVESPPPAPPDEAPEE